MRDRVAVREQILLVVGEDGWNEFSRLRRHADEKGVGRAIRNAARAMRNDENPEKRLGALVYLIGKLKDNEVPAAAKEKALAAIPLFDDNPKIESLARNIREDYGRFQVTGEWRF